jgi:hypothetical protein
MENIVCTHCHEPLSAGYYNIPHLVPCPSCQTPIKVDVFPALFRDLQPGKTGEALIDDQAGCFYHPLKKAVIPCDQCGRFLCALCDVEFGGKHVCTVCLETGQKKGKIVDLERHRTLYDSTALRLALYPLIIFYFTLVTAPITLYIAIRHWRSPMSIVRRTKIRFILAIAIAILEILAWIAGIMGLVSLLTRYRHG